MEMLSWTSPDTAARSGALVEMGTGTQADVQ